MTGSQGAQFPPQTRILVAGGERKFISKIFNFLVQLKAQYRQPVHQPSRTQKSQTAEAVPEQPGIRAPDPPQTPGIERHDEQASAWRQNPGDLPYGRSRVLGTLQHVMQHHRIQGIVRQRQFVQICLEVTEFTVCRALGLSGPCQRVQKQTMANHAPAHGIGEIRMAPCPEQRVSMEASRAFPHQRGLFGEETTTQLRIEPGRKPIMGGSCQVRTTIAKYSIHSDCSF